MSGSFSNNFHHASPHTGGAPLAPNRGSGTREVNHQDKTYLMPTIPEQIEKYLALAREIKELEIEKAGIAASILNFLETEGILSLDMNGHRVLRAQRKQYQYPDHIQSKEAELKALKREFEKTATEFEIKTYLTTKSIKENANV